MISLVRENMYTVSKSPLIQDHLHLIQDQLVEHTHTMISLVRENMYTVSKSPLIQDHLYHLGSIPWTYTQPEQFRREETCVIASEHQFSVILHYVSVYRPN